MPKRLRSDDEENFSCLVKNHISDREVNAGVLKEQNMKVVYNKTLEKLFNGAKNSANNNAENGVMDSVQENASHDRVQYRQLCLTSSGTFTKQPLAPPAASCCSCVNSSCLVRPMQVCHSCRGLVGDSCAKRCSSCTAITCNSCTGMTICNRCFQLFCSSCSMSVSENSCFCFDCQR